MDIPPNLAGTSLHDGWKSYAQASKSKAHREARCLEKYQAAALALKHDFQMTFVHHQAEQDVRICLSLSRHMDIIIPNDLANPSCHRHYSGMASSR